MINWRCIRGGFLNRLNGTNGGRHEEHEEDAEEALRLTEEDMTKTETAAIRRGYERRTRWKQQEDLTEGKQIGRAHV